MCVCVLLGTRLRVTLTRAPVVGVCERACMCVCVCVFLGTRPRVTLMRAPVVGVCERVCM